MGVPALNVDKTGSRDLVSRFKTEDSMKTCAFTLAAMVTAALCLSACGSANKVSGSPPLAAVNQWAWEAGANVVNQQGTYGTLGTAAPSNVPSARTQPVTWTDASGNFWLFGGMGPGSAMSDTFFNDLWKYSAGQWTWMGGSDLARDQGTYGTQGTFAPANAPGARFGAAGWIDSSGNFWLFGGSGYDSTGAHGDLNDLWKYQP
jgi:hypothetical protein